MKKLLFLLLLMPVFASGQYPTATDVAPPQIIRIPDPPTKAYVQTKAAYMIDTTFYVDSLQMLHLHFDTNAVVNEDIPGVLYWNNYNGALEVTNGDGSITTLSQENNIKVKNVSGSDIFNGYPVYIIPSGSDMIRVGIASKDDALKAYSSPGLATTDILHGDSGRMTTFGLVRDLNTSGFSESSYVYLDGGTLLSSPPDTGHVVAYGIVMRSHPTEGIIAVNPQYLSHTIFRVLDRYAENGLYFDPDSGIRYFGDLKPPHADLGFEDSTALFDLTQNTWVQLTNSYDSLFRVLDNEFINVSGDSIIFLQKGSYNIHVDLYAKGTAVLTTFQFRVNSNTGQVGIKAERSTSTNQTGSVTMKRYYEAEVGDRVWIEIVNISNDTDLTMRGASVEVSTNYLTK